MQPDRTKVLLLERGMIDRERLVKSPPKLSGFIEMGYPVKIIPTFLRDVLVSSWIDTDKAFNVDQDVERRLVSASRWDDDKNVQDVIVDFYDADFQKVWSESVNAPYTSQSPTITLAIIKSVTANKLNITFTDSDTTNGIRTLYGIEGKQVFNDSAVWAEINMPMSLTVDQ